MKSVNDEVQALLKIKEQIEKNLSILMALEKDTLFVFYSHEEGSDRRELIDWFFENNIIAKYESILLDDHPSAAGFPYHIMGYRFKDAEAAMAFKLAWAS